jgi:hypothetical protein
MTGSSLLPVSFYKGQLYFLFGKENPKEDSARGFSDFGGGVESGESIYNTALREGGEELTGFLGDSAILRKHIKKYGKPYEISHNDYHVHIFPLKYDPNLPTYYNQNHRFLWDRMNRNVLNKTKLFEKIQIQWFTPRQMRSRLPEFRSFYQDIVKQILSKEKDIKKYVKKGLKKKTRKKIPKSRNTTQKQRR